MVLAQNEADKNEAEKNDAATSAQREPLDYYKAFTQYSLMEDYGFASGLIRRLFRKFLPPVPPEHSLDALFHGVENPVEHALEAVMKDVPSSQSLVADLNTSIEGLSTKVAAFGLDSEVRDKFIAVSVSTAPFSSLLDQIGKARNSANEGELDQQFGQVLDAVREAIYQLRARKSLIGASLHLTLVTARILDCVAQLELLIRLRSSLHSEDLWRYLLSRRYEYNVQRHSLRRYVKRHTDLLALEVVEHTSDKGEKYIAENRDEYWSFLRRSLLGGVVISVFAFLKLVLDAQGLSDRESAFYFSLNYALCFMLVKKLGGIIATKQPAMTASTIAKYAGSGGDYAIGPAAELLLMIRRVFRSQFISLVGNFSMALASAVVVSFAISAMLPELLAAVVKPDYLLKNVLPSGQLVFFAAVAGVFLASAGLISGFVDNLMLASGLGERIARSPLFFRSQAFGDYVAEKGGALLGNFTLGFMLGCAFLLSSSLPFDLDIRHIAFSSANVGYALAVQTAPLATVCSALAGVLIIGAVNFVVSFSVTLTLALKSRGGGYADLLQLGYKVAKDFVRRPASYLRFPSREDAK